MTYAGKIETGDVMKKLKYVAAIIAGNALFAFAVAAFVMPCGILMGGITGVGIVVNKLFGFDTALFVLIVNAVLMIAGLFILGKKFFFSTIASSLLYPLFLKLFQGISVLSNLTDNLLLAAIFAGVLLGAAIGLLMRQGSSSGGTDIIGLIVNKYTHVGVAVIVWAADITVIGFQAFTSSSESLLLGIITIVIESYVLDKVMVFGKAQLQVYVISDKYEQIRKALISELNVGVTMTSIETGLMCKKQMGVMCIIHKRSLYSVTTLINSIDNEAFVTVTKIKEVRGQGFSRDRVTDKKP